MGTILALFVLGSAAWVWHDAGRCDRVPGPFARAAWKWGLGTLVLSVVVLPVYLVRRSKVDPRIY